MDYDSPNEYKTKEGKIENGVKELNGKVKNGRRKDPLRRAASEYNVSNAKTEDEGFGFSVRGDAPVVIAGVEPNSLADVSKLLLKYYVLYILQHMVFTIYLIVYLIYVYLIVPCIFSQLLNIAKPIRR